MAARGASKPWTPREDRVFKQYYPVQGIASVVPHLPARSLSSLRNRATKLGLAVRGRGLRLTTRAWTTREDAFIRAHYPAEGPSAVAARLSLRTPGAVMTRANKMGVFRDPQAPTSRTPSALKRKFPREYVAWACMRGRVRQDPRYGHLTIDPVWDNPRGGFQAFLDHVGPKPAGRPGGRDYSLDRIDNRRGYVPGNVRWATPKMQNRNRSSNKRFTFKGQTKCLVEWADVAGISSAVFADRLASGWPFAWVMRSKTKWRRISVGTFLGWFISFDTLLKRGDVAGARRAIKAALREIVRAP